MKRLFALLFFMLFTLTACNSTKDATKGVVDCYQISVSNGGSTVFSRTYQSSYSRVYEYKDANGNNIYINKRYQSYNGAQSDLPIYVYFNKYDNDYTEYTFSKFIGYLTVEYNYYLDLDNRMITSETKWSEYKYKSNPTNSSDDGTPDNKEAYRDAQKGYYQATFDGVNVTLKLDLTESNLIRNTYTKLGEDSIITYTAKWF